MIVWLHVFFLWSLLTLWQQSEKEWVYVVKVWYQSQKLDSHHGGLLPVLLQLKCSPLNQFLADFEIWSDKIHLQHPTRASGDSALNTDWWFLYSEGGSIKCVRSPKLTAEAPKHYASPFIMSWQILEFKVTKSICSARRGPAVTARWTLTGGFCTGRGVPSIVCIVQK